MEQSFAKQSNKWYGTTKMLLKFSLMLSYQWEKASLAVAQQGLSNSQSLIIGHQPELLYIILYRLIYILPIFREKLNICRTLNGKEVNSKLFSKCWIIIAIRFLLLITRLALSINSLQNNFLHQPPSILTNLCGYYSV